MMKIIEAKANKVEAAEIPGIAEWVFRHEIKATAADLKYTGPKFSREMWHEVLAFFKWTNAEHRSEAHVTLLVHRELGWRAWAFPQQGGTGMTIKHELSPESEARRKLERAQFGDGWMVYGSVHHHCNGGAFASGTDAFDESLSTEEGIHITVGWMDKDVHSLHFRFHHQGCKFEPDMSEFWETGEEGVAELTKRDLLLARLTEFETLTGTKQEKAREAIPRSPLHKVAEKQMAVTCAADAEFNDAWAANYLVKPKETYHAKAAHYANNGIGYGYQGRDQDKRGFPTRCMEALRQRFARLYQGDEHGDLRLAAALEGMKLDPDMTDVCTQLSHDQCNVADVLERLEQAIEKELEDEAKEGLKSEGGLANKRKEIHEMTPEEYQDHLAEAYGVGA